MMKLLRRSAADRLVREIPGTCILETDAPHILSASFPGYKSEVLMNYLDAEGVCVSNGSACKKGRRSHVLESMGLPLDRIDGTLRISLSRFTTAEEIDALCNALKEAVSHVMKARKR